LYILRVEWCFAEEVERGLMIVFDAFGLERDQDEGISEATCVLQASQPPRHVATFLCEPVWVLNLNPEKEAEQI